MNERPLQERNLQDPGRRRLSAGLCLALFGAAFAGCGGSLDEPEPVSVAAPTWDIVPSRALSLTPGGAFDLAATLPAAVPSGGVFEVDPGGAPLPQGITLTPAGMLSVSTSATGGTAGVVFRYTPPA